MGEFIKGRVLPAIVLLGFPITAWAQDAADVEEKPATTGNIIVTAQRIEQRLQDVPISITAVTEEEINRRGVSSLQDMQYAVPGLSSFRYGPGNEFIQIRGASSALGAPTVGTYYDELSIGLDQQASALDMPVIDMERVEVLRGPQATLYGDGSMGGTIRYIPVRPDLDDVEGSVFAELSDLTDGGTGYRVEGVMNIPLVTDRLAVRFAGGHERLAGFIDNPTLGTRDTNRTDVLTLRGSLRGALTERLTLDVSAQLRDVDQDGLDFGRNRVTAAAVQSSQRLRQRLVQVTLANEFDGATLSVIGGYIRAQGDIIYDVSPFFVPALTAPPPFGFGFPPGFITQVGLPGSQLTEQYSAEVRLQSNGDGPFRWLVGGEYRDLEGQQIVGSTTAPGTLPFAIVASDVARTGETKSVYGEVAYDVVDALTVTAGVRYFRNRRTQDSESTSFGFTTLDSNTGTFDTLNPRFNITYRLSEDSMVYGNIAKGFRSGGFNLTSAGGGVVTIPPTFEPDSIWTYEIGSKQSVFDRLLDFDIAVYYSDWTDVQSPSFAPGSPLTIVTNSGKVQGWGVDFGVSARLVAGLTLAATYSWNNLEFQNDTADKLRGDPVDNAVQETWSASVDYRTSLSDSLDGFLRADYQHAGRAQITLRNFGNQIVDRPSRDLVNLRAGVNFNNFELALFANNVFDEDAPNIIGPFGVIAENLEQRPRQIGISGRYSF